MKNSEFVHTEFKTLLSKFEAGNCSQEERTRLTEMVSDFGTSELLKTAMTSEISEFENEHSEVQADYKHMFEEIKNVISTRQKQARTRTLTKNSNLIRIAALIVLAFIFGGTLSYFLFNSVNKTPESFCEVTSPMGSTSQVLLPDHSSVWLNAGSKIRYSTSFNKENRFVYLEGEGYFKVAKNKKVPFVVDADGFEVKAVGTEFNVKAYKNDETIETTLVEGKVNLMHTTVKKMNNVYLAPNQKATFYKKKEDITIEVVKKIEEKKELNYIPELRLVINPNIDPEAIISWKEHRLIIEREQLGTLAEILGRKYNFNFEFKSEDIKNISFSGTLEDETLQQVMNVIKLSSPIDFEIVGKTVIIERNENRTQEFKKLYKQN